jgi:hypothetical protein
VYTESADRLGRLQFNYQSGQSNHVMLTPWMFGNFCRPACVLHLFFRFLCLLLVSASHAVFKCNWTFFGGKKVQLTKKVESNIFPITKFLRSDHTASHRSDLYQLRNDTEFRPGFASSPIRVVFVVLGGQRLLIPLRLLRPPFFPIIFSCTPPC